MDTLSIFAVILIAGIIGLGVYSYRQTTNVAPVVKKTVKKTPSTPKLSKARLTALTKAQLVEKGKELGVKVNTREVKSKIVNQVHKAQ